MYCWQFLIAEIIISIAEILNEKNEEVQRKTDRYWHTYAIVKIVKIFFFLSIDLSWTIRYHRYLPILFNYLSYFTYFARHIRFFDKNNT